MKTPLVPALRLAAWCGIFSVASLGATAQVVIVRGGNSERAVAICSGFVQGALTADVAGLDYNQLVWSGDGSSAATVDAVKSRSAKVVFTDSVSAAQALLTGVPDLRVVLAVPEDPRKAKIENNARLTVVHPLVSADKLFGIIQKNLKMHRLVSPHVEGAARGLPEAYFNDKRVSLTEVMVDGATTLGGLGAALDGADGVLLVPGALPRNAETAAAVMRIANEHKKTVISLDPEWVPLGIALAIYADPGEIGSAAGPLAATALTSGSRNAYVPTVSIAVRKGAAGKAGFDLKGLTLTRQYE